MKMIHFLALNVLGFILPNKLAAQTYNLGFQTLTMDRGFVIPHHEDMYHLYRPTISLQYQYVKPIEGTKNRMGVLFYGGQLGSTAVGNGFSANWLVERSLLKTTKVSIQTGFAMGLGWITNPYDISSNPTNRAIGSHGNAFGQAYLSSSFKIKNNWHFTGAIRFSHFSNGAWSAPNLGVNIPSISFGLAKAISQTSTISSREVSERLWMGFVSLRTGRKSLDIDDNRAFWVPVFEFGATRKMSKTSQLRMSLATHFDPYYRFEKFEPLVSWTVLNGLDMGVSLGYQQWFGKWGMLFDMGWYLYKPDKGYKTPYFEALGLSYRYNEAWEMMARLKANKTTADLIEFGLLFHW